MAINLKVNGVSRSVPAEPDTPLLYVLRNDLELNGAKFGCGLAQCGACTVLIGVMQERTALPSISTVQAPHCASPQPNFAPLSSRSLRST